MSYFSLLTALRSLSLLQPRTQLPTINLTTCNDSNGDVSLFRSCVFCSFSCCYICSLKLTASLFGMQSLTPFPALYQTVLVQIALCPVGERMYTKYDPLL